MKKNLIKTYETDASRFVGKAKEVFHPKRINEVKEIVISNKRIVPRGGGSGLSGGCIPQGGDVVIDLSLMNKIEVLDKDRGTIEVEAGVILSDLQDFLKKEGFEFPVNIVSKDVATIGGMIATNATGSRVGRYSKTMNWIQWIEIVDDEGRLKRKGATEISDYSGLEGITGIIVKACLKLEKLKKRSASLITLSNIEEVIGIVRNLKRERAVSSMELFDKKTSSWLNLSEGYNMIIEYEDGSGLIKGKDYEEVMDLVEKVYRKAYLKKKSRVEDPKMLVDRMNRISEWLEENEIPYFVHLSTGIIHPFFDIKGEKLIPEMIKLVNRYGGIASGSHGIGILKKGFVDSNDKKILENIKRRTDPLNKFNIGKVI